LCVSHHLNPLCLLNPLLQDTLEGNGIRSELRNTLPQLLDRHSLLVEVEAEQCLVIDVGLLLDVECLGFFSLEHLRHFVGLSVKLLQEVRLEV